MDLIVLAAGRNERLKGVVPAFLKPLLVVDGQPLIARIVDDFTRARNAMGHGDVIIVASPSNVDLLTQVLTPGCLFIIQPEPTGIVDALRLGLRVTTMDHAAMVCADNLIEPSAWLEPPFHSVPLDERLYVHGRSLPASAAARMTYFSKRHDAWIEKVTPRDEDPVFCWLGPIAFKVDEMREILHHKTETQQLGPLFNYYQYEVVRVESQSRDLGTIEELRS